MKPNHLLDLPSPSTPPSTDTAWAYYFRRNRENRPEPDWDAPVTMAPKRVKRLLPSLAQFELGDGGGSAYLIAWDRERFLREPGVRELVGLWFREEEEHSRLLGDLVKRFEGKSVSSHWSFFLFCTCRKWLGVRFELRALLLTEIVSHVYYRLLKEHVGKEDPALAQVCKLILSDEAGHIAFHRDRLSQKRDRPHGFLWKTVFRAMGLAAATVLWMSHGPILVRLGASTKAFYQGVSANLGRFLERLDRDCELQAFR